MFTFESKTDTAGKKLLCFVDFSRFPLRIERFSPHHDRAELLAFVLVQKHDSTSSIRSAINDPLCMRASEKQLPKVEEDA